MAARVGDSHVLVVDDDSTIREGVSDYLRQHAFRVTAVPDTASTREILAKEVVELIILDLKRESDDGLTLMRRVREESSIPIVVVSRRCDEADRVMGLELGADDYLTKPFSVRELLARVRTILRRRSLEIRQGRPAGVRAYRFEGWELNLNTRRLVSPQGALVKLTNGEFNLLVVLLNSGDKIVSREHLLERSRLHADEVYDRTIDVGIGRLRRKIEPDYATPTYIRTERGAGYFFAVPVRSVH
jgi:two-component system OmpR family response regulator